jgi:uncharacterized membrane protein (DUF485 family)
MTNQYSTSPPPANDGVDDRPSPEQAFAVVVDQDRRTILALTRSSRALYLAWGLAWLLGYGALWLGSAADGGPATWATTVFSACIVAAILVSVYLASAIRRQTSGAGGAGSAWYGVSWGLSFTVALIMLSWVGRTYHLSPEANNVLVVSVSALVVGAIYTASAAMLCDRTLFLIGVWMLVLCLVGTLLGLPRGFLAMGLAGGGGMLVALAWESWRLRHRSHPVR